MCCKRHVSSLLVCFQLNCIVGYLFEDVYIFFFSYFFVVAYLPFLPCPLAIPLPCACAYLSACGEEKKETERE